MGVWRRGTDDVTLDETSTRHDPSPPLCLLESVLVSFL